MEELVTTPSERHALWGGPVIDADVHVTVPSIDALLDHLEPAWAQIVRDRSFSGPLAALANVYPPAAPLTARAAWRPADGRPPASDLSLLREQLLDPWEVEAAVVNCYWAIDAIRPPDLAAALARGVNDWLIAEWLERDPRLRASIVVPPRQPEAIVREIERVADHPGFVSVLMPVRADRPYGNRVWHPVYEAMTRHELVLGLHWGGVTEGAPTPTGWPSWFAEEYSGEPQAYMAQIISLVAEGVFQRFPALRVAVQEGGFCWLPSTWWRMESKRKGLRRDIPWVDRPVPELIREHMRFTVAPLDAVPREELELVLEWLGSDELLLFATDYPHDHGGTDVATLLAATPAASRAKLMADNARALYRL